MHVSSALLLLGLPSGSAVPAAAQGNDVPSEQSITFYAGARTFDEDDYEPVEEHGLLGIEFSDETAGNAFGYEVGLQISGDEDEVLGVDVEAVVGEVYGGLHKTFGSGRLRPVLGAGLSFVTAAIDVGGADDDDSSLAGYAHAGLGLALGSNLTLGFDARVLFGSDLEIAGVETDADYGQFALFLGIGL